MDRWMDEGIEGGEKQMRGKMCLREQPSLTGPGGQVTDGWVMEGEKWETNGEIERQRAP